MLILRPPTPTVTQCHENNTYCLARETPESLCERSFPFETASHFKLYGIDILLFEVVLAFLGSRFVSITEDSKKWLKTPRIMSTKTLLGFNYKTCPIMLPELPWAPRDASVPQHTDNRHPGLVSGTGPHSSRRVSYIQFLD